MINKKQYNLLSYYLTRSLFLGGGISLLINISGNILILSSFLGLLLGYFLLYLFYKKGSINKICIVLISIMVLLINYLSNDTLTNTFLLSNTPTILIILVFLITCLYGSSKDLKVIGRVSEICIFITIITIFMGCIGLFKYIDINNLLPLLNNSFIDLIKGIVVFSSASLLPNLLLLDYKNDYKFREINKGYIWGSLSIIIIIFYILTMYGSDLASIVRFPEYLILKKIKVFNYISNLENILVLEWLINIIISGICITTILRNNTNKYLFYIINILIMVGEIILSINYRYVILVKNYCYYLFIVVILTSLLIPKKRK